MTRKSYKPQNLEETLLVNQMVSQQLHYIITKYKGFSDNKFLNYMNEYNQLTKEDGTKLVYESIRETSDENGDMKFVIFFKGDDEHHDYSFRKTQVVNWLRTYFEKCVLKIEWK